MGTELTQDQRKFVEQWVKEGCGLSEIQKRLTQQFGLSLTYMDVRFLVLDLGLFVKDKPESKDSKTDVSAASLDSSAKGAPGKGKGRVTVDVEPVTRAGFVVSGTVTFSDGVSATWGLDQFGRLALEASRPNYNPSRADVKSFQEELRTVLERRGF
jgi:hypothetical protein